MADEIKTYSEEEVKAMVQAETQGLITKRDELLNEAKRAKEALKNYEGVDPAEYNKLKEAAAEAERQRAAKEGDFQALQKQMADNHQKELSARDAKIAKQTKAIEKRLVDSAMRKAIMDAGGTKGMTDLLVKYGADFVRVRETDDDYESYVVDDRGNARIADGKGTPMDISAFVESELKTRFPDAFLGTGSSGSGAPKSAPSGGGVKTIAAFDNDAFLANLPGIANGTIKVTG